MSSKRDGPYLATAVFCENVLQEKDGTLSAIRIVDRVVVTTSGPEAPKEMPRVPVSLKALITLKSGAAKGKYMVALRLSTPSGRESGEFSMPIVLKEERQGHNLIIDVNLQVEEEGGHWFDVLLNDHLLTKMPLLIVYRRVTVGTSPEGG